MEPKRIAELHTFYASYWLTVTTFRYFEQQQFAVCPLWIEMNALIERTRLAITYSELNFMMILVKNTLVQFEFDFYFSIH